MQLSVSARSKITAHLLEQLIRVRTRIVAVGQKRHVLHGQTLIIGGHLIERLARAQRRTYQQLVIVQRNPQLVGKHAANLWPSAPKSRAMVMTTGFFLFSRSLIAIPF